MPTPLNGQNYAQRPLASTPLMRRRIHDMDELAASLYPYHRLGVQYYEDDFEANALDTTLWTAATDATATAFTPSAAGANGIALGVTGTTGNGYVGFNGAKVECFGNRYCGMDVIAKFDVVTGFTFEFGFTDALTDETLPAVTDIDTPAVGNGGAEVAVIHLDTSQTLTTAGLVTYNNSTAQESNLGTFTPTAATYYIYRIQLFGTTASAKILDMNYTVQAETMISSAILGTTAVRPHILAGTRNTTSKNVSVDLVRVWSDRSSH